MPKSPQKELAPPDTLLQKQIEDLRNQLLNNHGVRERIAVRAHELYVRRGAAHGHELQDWTEAEKEILPPLIEQQLKLSRKTSAETPNSATAKKVTAKKVSPAKPSSRKPK